MRILLKSNVVVTCEGATEIEYGENMISILHKFHEQSDTVVLAVFPKDQIQAILFKDHFKTMTYITFPKDVS